MISKDVTESSELCSTLVVQAELECPGSGHGIEGLEPRVVAERVQNVSVCLPQELEPRSDQLSVCAVLLHDSKRVNGGCQSIERLKIMSASPC